MNDSHILLFVAGVAAAVVFFHVGKGHGEKAASQPAGMASIGRGVDSMGPVPVIDPRKAAGALVIKRFTPRVARVG